MTSSPHPDEPDTEGKTLPPYEGRKESATTGEGATTGDAQTGGAAGPVEGAEQTTPDPEETPGGATGSPADEQPAAEQPDATEEDPEATGPAHTTGTGRAEDNS